MANTFYVPSESGWVASQNYYTRLKVVQSYNSANNRSTFTITPQFRGAYEINTAQITGGSIKADSTTLKSFGVEDNMYPYRAILLTTWSDIWDARTQASASWTYAKNHNPDGTCTINFTDTVVLGLGAATFNGSSSKTFPGTARTYTLTVTADAHATVTVKDGNTTLSSGSTITYGHTLTVTAAAANGYQVKTFTINGTSKTSPATVAVTGNVTVAVTTEALGFAYLRTGSAWSPYLIYLYVSGAWQRYRAYIYTNGAWRPY